MGFMDVLHAIGCDHRHGARYWALTWNGNHRGTVQWAGWNSEFDRHRCSVQFIGGVAGRYECSLTASVPRGPVHAHRLNPSDV